jgi:hypothetical protein
LLDSRAQILHKGAIGLRNLEGPLHYELTVARRARTHSSCMFPCLVPSEGFEPCDTRFGDPLESGTDCGFNHDEGDGVEPEFCDMVGVVVALGANGSE